MARKSRRKRRGLREPLLQQQPSHGDTDANTDANTDTNTDANININTSSTNTHTNSNHGSASDDEETGRSSDPARTNETQGSQGNETPTTTPTPNPTPLLHRDYRLATLIIGLLDLCSTLTISWFLHMSQATVFHQDTYTLTFSALDIFLMTCIRSPILLFQVSTCISLRATKIVGYISLLSLLFLITKACSVTTYMIENKDDTDATPPPHGLYLTLLIVNMLFCFMECICTFLVGIFSSDDLSVTVAPTAREAAQGIAFDADQAQTIGLWKLMLVLKPYFWPDGLLNRGCVFLTWVFLIMSKACNIAAPLYIAKATDDLSSDDNDNNNGKMTSIVKHVIMYASLLLFNKVLKEAQALAYIRVKLIAGVQLKEQIFAHLLSLSMDWHQRKSMGTVITAMQRGINASNMVVQNIFLYLFPTAIEAIVVSVVFVQAFGAPLLAAVAINGCTLYIIVTVELTIFRMQYRKRMNKADNDASHKVTDSLMNIETVKYFTAEEHEVQRYRENVETFKDQAGKIQGSLSLLNTAQQIVLNSTLVAALLIAANEYSKGDFTVGQFVAVNVYVMQLFAPLNFLGSIYSMAVGSYVDLQNLCNMFAERPDIQDKANAETLVVAPNTPLEIEFRDVNFAYPSRTEVNILKGVSFHVAAGSTTAIVGQTGSGKSTITRLLFRFYEADQGQVLIGGRNVLDLTKSSLRGHVGIVPQDHTLFNDTLRYNIRYGARDSEDGAVERAAQAAELNEFISSLPEGLDTIVGERGQQVSGGQKQRVAIARVLMKECPVVILDEATSSLDSRTEEQIQKSLECLQGRTMLVIAHRLSTIQNADQIIVMFCGEILESGTHETLIAKGNWHESCYASLWDKQKKAE